MAGKTNEDMKNGGTVKFRTTIITAGKTATGIVVPDEIVEKLGAGKKPPVSITINGFTYRSSIATMGGKYMVGVSAENRKGAGVAGGDEVDVTIALDTEERSVTIPDDFRKALSRDKEADKYFEGLSYSNKRRIVLQIEDAKTAETRERRISKAVAMLQEGRNI